METTFAFSAAINPAAEIVSSARQAAGFSQTELAARVGTTQSAVSRWESGKDEPRLSTLGAILRACGKRLVLTAQPDDVDRAQLRQQLAMTPQQRLDSVINVSATLASAKRVS